jgi:hypothetical protein
LTSTGDMVRDMVVQHTGFSLTSRPDTGSAAHGTIELQYELSLLTALTGRFASLRVRERGLFGVAESHLRSAHSPPMAPHPITAGGS